MASPLESRRAAVERRMKELDKARVKNGKELTKAVKEWADLAHEHALLSLLAALGRCFVNLLRRTPVDTGRARAGWIVDTGPREDAPAARDYDEWKGNASSAISRAIADFESAHDWTKADAIWVMNNVEYILPLEAGWSKTQDGGFFALFIEELKNELDKAIKAESR